MTFNQFQKMILYMLLLSMEYEICQLSTAPVNQPGFHYYFEDIKVGYPNIQPIRTENGGCRIYYFNYYTNGSWNLLTKDYVKFTAQKTRIDEPDVDHPATLVYLDDRTANTRRTILFNRDFDIQFSADDGLTWTSKCRNCSLLVGHKDRYMNYDVTAFWNRKTNTWIAPYLYSPHMYIMSSYDWSTPWNVSPVLFETYDVGHEYVQGIFEISELGDQTHTKTIAIIWNGRHHQAFAEEITIALNEGIPNATIVTETRRQLEYGSDLNHLVPVNDGSMVKSDKILIPVYYNWYVEPSLSKIIKWYYCTGTPRRLTFKMSENKLVFYQEPFIDVNDAKLWGSYSLSEYKIDRETTPFICKNINFKSFILTANFDTITVQNVGFYVRGNSDFSKYLEIGFNKTAGCYLSTQRDSPMQDTNPDQYTYFREYVSGVKNTSSLPDILNFVTVVDNFIVELICFDGTFAVGAIIFPDPSFTNIKLIGNDDVVMRNFSINRFLLNV